MPARKTRVVTLGQDAEFTERELAAQLVNQAESSVVRAIVQVIDDEALYELNASLDQSQSERVCAAHAGGAQALLGLKARLADYMLPPSKAKAEEEDG
jgi:hypothetical protein